MSFSAPTRGVIAAFMSQPDLPVPYIYDLRIGEKIYSLTLDVTDQPSPEQYLEIRDTEGGDAYRFKKDISDPYVRMVIKESEEIPTVSKEFDKALYGQLSHYMVHLMNHPITWSPWETDPRNIPAAIMEYIPLIEAIQERCPIELTRAKTRQSHKTFHYGKDPMSQERYLTFVQTFGLYNSTWTLYLERDTAVHRSYLINDQRGTDIDALVVGIRDSITCALQEMVVEYSDRLWKLKDDVRIIVSDRFTMSIYRVCDEDGRSRLVIIPYDSIWPMQRVTVSQRTGLRLPPVKYGDPQVDFMLHLFDYLKALDNASDDVIFGYAQLTNYIGYLDARFKGIDCRFEVFLYDDEPGYDQGYSVRIHSRGYRRIYRVEYEESFARYEIMDTVTSGEAVHVQEHTPMALEVLAKLCEKLGMNEKEVTEA